MAEFDPRVTPVTDQFAADFLRGTVERPRYREGVAYRIFVGEAAMLKEPRPDAVRVSTALFGESFTLYDRMEGYGWGQLGTDGYMGWVAETALMPGTLSPTHCVSARATHLYAGPGIRSAVVARLPVNALLCVVSEKDGYGLLDGGAGAVPLQHITPLGQPAQDFVTVAESLLGAPYLWGGRSDEGLDCSGLTQAALLAAGIACPRDSDQQQAGLGEAIAKEDGLQRGDLIFWKGHVGVMISNTDFLHANAHHMAVEVEPFAQAKARIGAKEFGDITGMRRLKALSSS